MWIIEIANNFEKICAEKWIFIVRTIYKHSLKLEVILAWAAVSLHLCPFNSVADRIYLIDILRFAWIINAIILLT